VIEALPFAMSPYTITASGVDLFVLVNEYTGVPAKRTTMVAFMEYGCREDSCVPSATTDESLSKKS
jgi:hypothetical protein